MNKTKNKKTKRSIISLLLIAALIITGIFAFMTAKDSKTNVFTVGSVDIEIKEDEWDAATDSNNNGIPDYAENVLPRDVVVKDPRIENTGDNEAYVFATVAIPTSSASDFYSMDENGAVNIAGQTVNINIKGYAFQKDCYDTTDDVTNAALKIWAGYNGANSIENINYTNLFGPAATDTTSRYELFCMATGSIEDENFSYSSVTSYNGNKFVHEHHDDWTPVGDVYQAEDGYNYYVFLYKPANTEATRLEAGASTDTIFDCVVLNENLGSSGIAYVDLVIAGHTTNTTHPAINGAGYTLAEAKAAAANILGITVDELEQYYTITGSDVAALEPDVKYTFTFEPNFALFNITIDGEGTKQYRLPAGATTSAFDTDLGSPCASCWQMAREVFGLTSANFNTTNYTITYPAGTAAFSQVANENTGAIAGEVYNITFTAA